MRKYETHGDTGTRLYRIYKSMKCRCTLSSHPSYKNYGARGITICDEWLNSYECFREWAVSHGYFETLELERTDVNGNYSPNNCKWISHYEQTMNRRDTLYVTVHGEKQKLREFCKQNGININSVNNWRYKNILEEKLSRIMNTPVSVSGGKKEVV